MIIDRKIKSYEDFVMLLQNNEDLNFNMSLYSNDERLQLRSWFFKAKQNCIKNIDLFSDSEIFDITKLNFNNFEVKKYDIVKFYGINDFVETGIIKRVIENNCYEIQTLDKKSIIYFGEYELIEKIGYDKTFSFNSKKFHSFKKGKKIKLNFSEQFLKEYTKFYNNNFNIGIDAQLKDFEEIWKMKLNNVYDLEIYEYDGRYSYCCKLNNQKTLNTFIIHEDLIKNHAI